MPFALLFLLLGGASAVQQQGVVHSPLPQWDPRSHFDNLFEMPRASGSQQPAQPTAAAAGVGPGVSMLSMRRQKEQKEKAPAQQQDWEQLLDSTEQNRAAIVPLGQHSHNAPGGGGPLLVHGETSQQIVPFDAAGGSSNPFLGDPDATNNNNPFLAQGPNAAVAPVQPQQMADYGQMLNHFDLDDFFQPKPAAPLPPAPEPVVQTEPVEPQSETAPQPEQPPVASRQNAEPQQRSRGRAMCGQLPGDIFQYVDRNQNTILFLGLELTHVKYEANNPPNCFLPDQIGAHHVLRAADRRDIQNPGEPFVYDVRERTISPPPECFIQLTINETQRHFAPNGSEIPKPQYDGVWRDHVLGIKKVPAQPVNFHANGAVPQRPDFKNAYPLSRGQLKSGLDQAEIRRRANGGQIDAQVARLIAQNHNKWPANFFANMRNRELKRSTEIAKKTLVLVLDDQRNFNDFDDVIDILVASSNEEKAQMGLSDAFCGKIMLHPAMREKTAVPTLNRFGRILRALCEKRPNQMTWRDERFDVDETKAIEDAAILYKYYSMRDGDLKNTATEQSLIRVLVESNYSQLRLTFDKFATYTRPDEPPNISKFTTKKFEERSDDPFWATIDAIVTDVQLGRPFLMARMLRAKLEKLSRFVPSARNRAVASANDNPLDAHWDVARILVTRAGVDLKEMLPLFIMYHQGRWQKETAGLVGVLQSAARKSGDPTKYAHLVELVRLVNDRGPKMCGE